jgi:hypothetical protein
MNHWYTVLSELGGLLTMNRICICSVDRALSIWEKSRSEHVYVY